MVEIIWQVVCAHDSHRPCHAYWILLRRIHGVHHDCIWGNAFRHSFFLRAGSIHWEHIPEQISYFHLLGHCPCAHCRVYNSCFIVMNITAHTIFFTIRVTRGPCLTLTKLLWSVAELSLPQPLYERYRSLGHGRWCAGCRALRKFGPVLSSIAVATTEITKQQRCSAIVRQLVARRGLGLCQISSRE